MLISTQPVDSNLICCGFNTVRIHDFCFSKQIIIFMVFNPVFLLSLYVYMHMCVYIDCVGRNILCVALSHS